MELMEFLKENWRIAVVLLVEIALLLVTILRKRVKVVDSAKEFILAKLPDVIVHAEKSYSDLPKSGLDKKLFCIAYISSLLLQEFNISDFDPYLNFTCDQLEKILATPQKKGE